MKRRRNESVEKAVDIILDRLDRLSEGEVLGEPAPRNVKAIFDSHIESQRGSVRLACAFLAAYSLIDEEWDFKTVPVGARGKYGDKRLAGELTQRHVTLHNSITAFGENLGWKGAVRQFDLSADIRFASFVSNLECLQPAEREALVNHIVWRLEQSKVIPQALPVLPRGYLSYARSLRLCERLMKVPSEGHIQQFLVAAFIEVHRKRYGHRVITHHPHASDKFDGATGDIEEYREDLLIAAFEVTVRDDWKNRLSDFQKKAVRGNLPKYVIFASDVRGDSDLYPASKLIDFIEHLSFDLAVVDLSDFFSVFCAELTREEIGQAINRAYHLLTEPRLCGREDFIGKYREVTNEWLDS
ncbi:hypothetical protein [Thiorhodococcus fuscus]|uniref:Restriction endonuclease n=1 Tax=Thiorhodococcus fuscus TaxID=527200 RepID=A0ABW4Y6G9_9GAMM